MTSIALHETALRAAKRALSSRLPNEKSSHLTEALAVACGYETHAALLAAIRENGAEDPAYVLLDVAAFEARLRELSGPPVAPAERLVEFEELTIEDGGHILTTHSAKMRKVDYSTSLRRRAWRNAMVAGINAGLSLRLFSLLPSDNRWSGACFDHRGDQRAHVFHFDIGDIPAAASLWDAGWDEISVHVALWPTAESEKWVATANAGFLAGELYASGWLERRQGAWLQVPSDSGNNWNFRCRKDRLATAAALTIRPAGYADHGSFAL